MASDSENEQNDLSILDECSKYNEEKTISIEVNKCKNCKKYYKSLLKHLGQIKLCKNSYSEQEIQKLKINIKSVSNSLKRGKEKVRYEQNKENTLRKRQEYYQKNKQFICKKKSDYYQKNSEKILQRRAAAYQMNRKTCKGNYEERKTDDNV